MGPEGARSSVGGSAAVSVAKGGREQSSGGERKEEHSGVKERMCVSEGAQAAAGGKQGHGGKERVDANRLAV